MTLRLRAAALMTVVMVLSACSGGGGTTPSSASTPAASAPAGSDAVGASCADPKKVTLGYHTISQSVWPMWIAQEQGMLEKDGIDSDLIFAEGSRILSGVISKATPIAFASAIDLLDPLVQGADLKAIYAFEDGTPTDMIVSAADITSPEQLKGKIAGANELGGESDSEMRLALKQMGLTPDVDTRVVAVGGESTRIAALKSGQVSATLVDVGLKQQMKDLGFNILYDFSESDIHVLKSALITTESYAAENPDTVQCVVKALVEAIRFEKANRTESVDAAAKYSGDQDRKSLEVLWDTYAAGLPDVPKVNLEAFQNVQKYFSKDPKAQALDLSTVVDNSYVETAAEQLGQ